MALDRWSRVSTRLDRFRRSLASAMVVVAAFGLSACGDRSVAGPSFSGSAGTLDDSKFSTSLDAVGCITIEAGDRPRLKLCKPEVQVDALSLYVVGGTDFDGQGFFIFE